MKLSGWARLWLFDVWRIPTMRTWGLILIGVALGVCMATGAIYLAFGSGPVFEMREWMAWLALGSTAVGALLVSVSLLRKFFGRQNPT
jgi:hypothetical protein